MGRPIPARGRCAGPGRPHRSPQGTRGPSQRGRGRRRPYFEGEVMDAGAGRARAEQQQQQQPQHGPSAAGRHLCSSVSVPRAPLPGQASHVSGGARHVTAVGGAGSCQGVMEGLGMGRAQGFSSATPCPGRDTSRYTRVPQKPV